MIIPNKYSGYSFDGVRRCFGGGGGGGGGGDGGDGGNPGAGGDGPNMPYSPPVTNTGGGGGFTTPTPWNAGAGAGVNRQPVYQPQYQNYARPATQFDTSMYGTQPVQSPLSTSGATRETINRVINNFYNTNPQGRNADINSTLGFMRDLGVNRTDIQAYGGVNNYGPQMSMPQMQNPYAQQQSQMPQQQMQTPFSFQQPSYQPQMQMQPSYQQPNYGSSQLPNYVSQTIRDLDQYQSQPVQAYQSPFARSSGPRQPIVGRSSQMRGTPNVMRRAEGGIAALMDDEE